MSRPIQFPTTYSGDLCHRSRPHHGPECLCGGKLICRHVHRHPFREISLYSCEYKKYESQCKCDHCLIVDHKKHLIV